MSTLGTMEDRIIAELVRTDIAAARIRDAVRSAVAHYQKEPWFFTEDRSVTFTTSTSQGFYGASDNAEIPNFQSIERLTLTFNTTQRATLTLRDNDWIEDRMTVTTLTGRPTDFAYFGKQIRVYPLPDAAYEVRITGHKRLGTLSATTDGNAWMTDAEELIRCRAKWLLYVHVIKPPNPKLPNEQKALELDAYDALKGEYAAKGSSGRVRPTDF